MTIKEKAKDFAGLKSDSKDVLADLFKSLAYKGYMEGATWMLEKAVKWLKENAQNYYEDASMHDNCWYDDEQMIEDFQKAMEE
jgi:hypothetical protein